MKKIKYDLIVSIISLCTSIFPIIFVMMWVEIAKANGNYYSGSGHDIAILLSWFMTCGIACYHGTMLVISAINDFKTKDAKKQNIVAIVMTVLNVLGVLGNVAITLLLFLPSSPLNL